MEEDRLFDMLLVQLTSHSEKNKAVSLLHPLTKINSRWMKMFIKKRKHTHPKRATKECKAFSFYNLEVGTAFNKHLLNTYSLTLCSVLEMGTSRGPSPPGTQTSEGGSRTVVPRF